MTALGPLRLLTPRGWGLVTAAIVLWATGRLIGVRALWVAAVAALAVVVCGLVWVVVEATSVHVRRRVAPGRLFHGASAGVELALRNEGRVSTGATAISDDVPDRLPASARFVLGPVRPGGTARLRYQIVGAHRGVYDIGPVTVHLRDPFGVATRAVASGGQDALVVYPPVHRLAVGLPLRGMTGSEGAARPRPGISGDEVATVREYVQGDDLRKVHWRSTAHRGELMVRQDESPDRPTATIVADVRAKAHRGTGPGDSLETVAGAAASIAYHIAERGFDAALLTGPVRSHARPAPWEATLERIARLTTTDEDLGALWQQLATTSGGSGLLFAVVCVPDPALLRQMVRAGRAASVKVALLVDAEAHAPRGRRTREPVDVARALRAAGWRVAVLGADDDLPARWQELLVAGRPTVRSVT